MNKSLISSIAYTNNLMFFTGLIVLLTLFGFSSLAAEIGLVYSIVATVNQIFSYNLKNLILFNNDKNFALEVFNLRIFLGVITLVSCIIILDRYDLGFYSNKLVILVTVIVIQQWLLEVFLIMYEMKNRYKLINIFNFISFTNVFIVIINVAYFDNKYLLIIFYFIAVENLFVLLYFLNINNILKLNFLKIFHSISRLFVFTSSLAVILSIFFWRVFIYLNYEKDIAGILFSSFAVGSFIGTFFASAIGPTLIKNNIKIMFYSKLYLFLSIFFSIILYFFLQENLIKIDLNLNEVFFIKALIYSIAGSSFMLFAVIFRLDFFYKNKSKREHVYKNDIINSIFISIIPIIFFIYDKNTIMFSFLAASIITFIFYFYLYRLKA